MPTLTDPLAPQLAAKDRMLENTGYQRALHDLAVELTAFDRNTGRTYRGTLFWHLTEWLAEKSTAAGEAFDADHAEALTVPVIAAALGASDCTPRGHERLKSALDGVEEPERFEEHCTGVRGE